MTSSKKKRLDDPFYALKGVLNEKGDAPAFQAEMAERLFAIVGGGRFPFPSEPTKFDDRALAILYASRVELTLEEALASRFACDQEHTQRLFSYNEDGALSTFASKISIGLAIGLFSKAMLLDLKLYNAIRNCFAHARIHVDFNHEAVELACNKLNVSKFNAGETPGLDARAKYYLSTTIFVTILHSLSRPEDHAYAEAIYKTLYNEPPPLPKK